MKTIFYKNCNDADADYYLNNKPYKKWFELDNILYSYEGNVVKETIITENEYRFITSVSITIVKDQFSDNGIIRHIGLTINNY